MSEYIFKGDIETVRAPQLEFIRKVLEKRGFKERNVLIETVGTAADNYVANVKRIVITENGVTHKMIVKLAPDQPMAREMANAGLVFQNEHLVYTEILPKFRELQKSAGVPENEYFKFAECYGSYTEEPNEVIVLEDLKPEGFEMLDKLQPLPVDCVKYVLKNFAILHSLSYALKHQEPETFAAFKNKLKDPIVEVIKKRDEMNIFLQQLEQGALRVLDDDRYKKVVKGNVSDLINNFIKANKNNIDSKHSIIQHGDGWTNNILFKMEGDVPVSCVLIDYQMAKENNPAYDLMYMLFNSTSHEQRQKYYYEFLDYYHTELDKSLNNYGLKAASVFSKDQLDADLKRHAKQAFATCIMVSSFILRDAEEAAKFKETLQNSEVNIMDIEHVEATSKGMIVQAPATMMLYKSRVEQIIDSFLEFGLL